MRRERRDIAGKRGARVADDIAAVAAIIPFPTTAGRSVRFDEGCRCSLHRGWHEAGGKGNTKRNCPFEYDLLYVNSYLFFLFRNFDWVSNLRHPQNFLTEGVEVSPDKRRSMTASKIVVDSRRVCCAR